jgi:hypothetical protein
VCILDHGRLANDPYFLISVLYIYIYIYIYIYFLISEIKAMAGDPCFVVVVDFCVFHLPNGCRLAVAGL